MRRRKKSPEEMLGDNTMIIFFGTWLLAAVILILLAVYSMYGLGWAAAAFFGLALFSWQLAKAISYLNDSR